MKTTALILVVALAPSAAIAQVATGQEEVLRLAEAATTQQDVQLSVDASERLEVPQRLLRTFELLKEPGIHPELVELLGLNSELDAEGASSLASTTLPAALSTGNWVAIGAGIAIAVVLLGFLAYQGSI